MNGRELFRGTPPGDQPPPREPRRLADSRNGGPTLSIDSSMTRAERFEDEKRRIVQSCFSKKDPEGALVESYITHIRVIEDASYPSSPPPPSSAADNKKARVIIVAVRRSGRVRMHKARENSDGSFSIGKTWVLDDLSAIQCYTGLAATTPTEQQHIQWASNVGFMVTIGKPYYWQAGTSKEREFFIGSLVKIYKKYTAGKLPTLIGFDEREQQLYTGSPMIPSPGGPGSRGPPSGQQYPDSTLNAPRPPSAQANRPQSPYSNRAPSRDGNRDLRKPSADEASLRAQRSRDQIRRPSTGQPGRIPGPPAGPPPAVPSEQRDQPPPRAMERLAADGRMAKPAGMEEAGPRSRSKPSVDSDEASLASSQTELRTLSSRDERGMPELRPVASHDSRASSPEMRRTKESLRPTTPASTTSEKRTVTDSPAGSLGQRSLGNETERASLAESQSRIEDVAKDTSVPAELLPSRPAGLSDSGSARSPSARSGKEEPGPATSGAFASAESPPDTQIANPPGTAETVSSALSPPPEPSEEDDQAHRPGLGPMVKKKSGKDIAGAFRKAATAYNAFRPRAGGAGERLLAAAKKAQTQPDEPDGITSVVPAPSLRATADASTTLDTDVPPTTSTPVMTPTVEVTQPPLETVVNVPTPGGGAVESVAGEPAADGARLTSPRPQERPRRRREDNTAKYCQALGIDPGVLEGRGLDFDDILTDLGWNGRLSDDKRIEDLEADVRREIGRVEATSWLGNLEQQEGKVDQLARLIDKTIEECEELDGLLTLYSHELNTLRDDVAYIEAQSQGLQVQTANQKILQNELQNLLKTLSISSSDLQPLREASLSNPEGLKDAENALAVLYKAMLTIDSDVWHNKKRLADAAGEHGSVGVYADTEVGQMRAIKEKKEEYRSQARLFLQRLKQFMAMAFKMAEQKMNDAATNGSKDPLKLDSVSRDYFRQELWMYNALMLFARDVSVDEWRALIALYEQQAKGSYQNEFRDNGLAWKKTAKKPTGDEQELLFTHQEKERDTEMITMAARKLTVRRGKTVRATAGLRLSLGEKQSGKVEPCEAFAGTLQETLRMISGEQNFIVHFFHLNSLANVEFADLVSSASPDARRRPDFYAKQVHDPDREMAKKVEQTMDDIYAFWPNDMQNLVDWATNANPLQGIGILLALENAIADFEETNQDFIVHSLQKVHSRLVGLFNRFVDEQIRGIEETKVKVNKRKGVISFMRVFPNFLATVENMLDHPSQEFRDVRVSVNDAYERINRAMWESLKFIAKEAPGQQPAAAVGGGDPEDKEVLNYHILLIENMNHYVEEVDVRGIPVLERWHSRAHQDFQEHMKLYQDAVIRRPLGKLLDFIESTEALLTTTSNPSDIANRASHSRSVAKKVIGAYDAKEIRRGIEMLKKRVDKHFGDADDPGLSRSLVLKVLRECEARYEDAHDRMQRIIESVYEGQLELEWRKEDAIAMFKK